MHSTIIIIMVYNRVNNNFRYILSYFFSFYYTKHITFNYNYDIKVINFYLN